jgi:hypothetical protein
MNRASGNEKGIVENLCQHIRPIAYSPIPKGSSLMDIHEKALLKLDDHNKTHQIKGKPASILELSKIESERLTPLPRKHFNPYSERICDIDKFSTFTYDTCKYSVPSDYIGKKVSLKFSPYQIECWSEGVKIATHMRSLSKNQQYYVLDHYITLLEQKPRAQNDAAPAKFGETFPELETFREKCKEPDKYRQVVQLLFLCRDKGQEMVLKAIEQANKNGLPTYEKVIAILKIASLDYNVDNLLNDDKKGKLNLEVKLYDLNEYDNLIEGTVSPKEDNVIVREDNGNNDENDS